MAAIDKILRKSNFAAAMTALIAKLNSLFVRKETGKGLSTNDYNFEDDGRESLLLRVYGEGRFLGIGHYDRKSQSIMPDKVIHHI